MIEVNSKRTSSLPNSRWISLAKCFVKWSVSLAIIVFLIARTDFQPLTSSIKTHGVDPLRFFIGFLFCSFSVFLTLIRWRTLLTALGVAVDTAHVMRVGLLSYALNLLALGSVGGDVGRVVLFSRLYPAKRPEVMLSVAFDRIIGLYAMFVIAFVFVVMENLFVSGNQSVQFVAWLTVAGTFLIPAGSVFLSWTIEALPSSRIGGRLQTMMFTLTTAFGGHACPKATFRALLISLTLRTTTAIGIYFFGTSLLGNVPDVRLHLLAVSIGLLTGCLPLPFNGLGALEAVLEFAFQTFPVTPCPTGYGIAVALIYRTFLLGVGLLGAVVFAFRSGANQGRQAKACSGYDEATVPRPHFG